MLLGAVRQTIFSSGQSQFDILLDMMSSVTFGPDAAMDVT